MSSMMQSSNPVFSEALFDGWTIDNRTQVSAGMTVRGTASKTLVLLMILTTCAAFTWTQMGQGGFNPMILLGALGAGLVLSLITVFKMQWAMYTSPLYAACQGVVMGAISNFADQRYPGVAAQAMGLTFATTFVMLFLYGMRIVRVSQGFIAAVAAGTGALAIFYLGSFVLGMFGVSGPMAMISGSGPFGIGISIISVSLAALNLLLDFHFIEEGERSEAPRWMEWYGAFGLMVTLIWLYVAILRLLLKLNDRN
jgi:uncharacterized YccA/Bax inhibitor family protein